MKTLLTCLIVTGLLASSLPADPVAGMRALEELRQRHEDIRQVNRYSQESSQAVRDVDDMVRQLGDTMGREFQAMVAGKRRAGGDMQLDDVTRRILAAHPADWEVIWRAAVAVRSRPATGMYSGVYDEVDFRLGSLRLYLAAEQRIPDGADGERLARFYRDFADVMAGPGSEHWRSGIRRHDDEATGRLAMAWHWLPLTDLGRLPDPGDPSLYPVPATGHPVDAHGDPVYFGLPESWESAANDGERWRWLKQRQMEVHPERAAWVTLDLADRWRQFYGTSNLPAGFAPALRDLEAGAEPWGQGNVGALHELADSETVSQLETGIRRFELAEGFRFIGMYRQLAAVDGGTASEVASQRLAWIYTARGQYGKAAEMWRRAIEHGGDRPQPEHLAQLGQITGNLGRFEPHNTQPAGRPARLGFLFRNARQARFTARPVDMEGLIQAAVDYLDPAPRGSVHWQAEVERFGQWLVPQAGWPENRTDHFQGFLGDIRHEWTVELEPAPEHRDRRVEIGTPLDEAGAWLVRAELTDGNVSTILLWIADTVLMRKPVPDGMMYLVRDALDGSPIAGAEIELVGYRTARPGAPTRRHQLTTDEQGRALLPRDEEDGRFEWLTVARTADGRLAHLGMEHQGIVWSWGGPGAGRVSGLMVSDRPVYHPGHQVRLMFRPWRAGGDQEDVVAGGVPGFSLHAVDPARREVWITDIDANEGGSGVATFRLPDKALPGVWRVLLRQGDEIRGARTILVVEEHEPEFRVIVGVPDEPVRSGAAFEAVVRVQDLAGEPVRDVAVQYKVSRKDHDHDRAPPAAWDWLYGGGYGWLPPTVEWHPDFSYRGSEPHQSIYTEPAAGRWDLVADGEMVTDPDGTARIRVDTVAAALLHGDSDHIFTVSARVADASGGIAAGSGSVTAARRDFEVLVVADRGFYEPGSAAVVSIHARSPDGAPVEGRGAVRLMLQDYDEDREQWVEREMARSAFILDKSEPSLVELPMSAAGQYRVAASVDRHAGGQQEGGVFLVVPGEDAAGEFMRFNTLELIPEKPEYQPGETLRLLINSSRPNALVELYARPERGGYGEPVLLRLDGKSRVIELPLDEDDVPNLFVEAVLIDEARVHAVTRMIAVPPVARVLDLRVEPSAAEVRPGDSMEVSLRLTDADGAPVRGEVAMTVYDRSLDAVAGDATAAGLRSRFLGGTRRYEPFLRNSLVRPTTNVHPQDTTRWAAYGASWVTAEMDGRDAFVVGGAPVRPLIGKRPPHEIDADRIATRAQPFETQPHGHFAGTVFWSGSLATDDNGRARVRFDVPEHEAEWVVRAWAVSGNDTVGEASAVFESSVAR